SATVWLVRPLALKVRVRLRPGPRTARSPNDAAPVAPVVAAVQSVAALKHPRSVVATLTVTPGTPFPKASVTVAVIVGIKPPAAAVAVAGVTARLAAAPAALTVTFAKAVSSPSDAKAM